MVYIIAGNNINQHGGDIDDNYMKYFKFKNG
jgi:hypothetical protein